MSPKSSGSKNKKSKKPAWSREPWFLAWLFFDPEDGGDMFLWNVGWLSTTTWRYIPEDWSVHNHHCENLKSYNSRLLSLKSCNQEKQVGVPLVSTTGIQEFTDRLTAELLLDLASTVIFGSESHGTHAYFTVWWLWEPTDSTAFRSFLIFLPSVYILSENGI
jgi:hypothetical protein